MKRPSPHVCPLVHLFLKFLLYWFLHFPHVWLETVTKIKVAYCRKTWRQKRKADSWYVSPDHQVLRLMSSPFEVPIRLHFPLNWYSFRISYQSPSGHCPLTLSLLLSDVLNNLTSGKDWRSRNRLVVRHNNFIYWKNALRDCSFCTQTCPRTNLKSLTVDERNL